MSRLLLLLVPMLVAADWPQFRGPAGDSRSPGRLPPEIGPNNLAWKADIPGSGWAQPVVVGETVYVATAVSDPPLTPRDMMGGIAGMPKSVPGQPATGPKVTIDWTLLALDLGTGKTKWATKVVSGQPKYAIHPTNTFATETPCADAERVYVYFATAGVLAALDPAGKEVWRNAYPPQPTASDLGPGASPALHDGKLYLILANEAEARLVCLDPATGKEKWVAARDKFGTAWASPFVWKSANRTEVVFCGKGSVTGHDPDSGKELWRLNGIDSSFSASPTATADVLVFGNGGPGSASPLIGVKAGAAGDITLKKGETSGEHVAFYKTGAAPGMSSPVAVGDNVYVLNNGGLACYEAKTGKQLYKERLLKAKTVACAPVAAGGTILYLDETGAAVLVKAGNEFEAVAGGKFDDLFWSSPALAGDKLLLRGAKALYCVKR